MTRTLATWPARLEAPPHDVIVVNGRHFDDPEEAVVSVLDRGYLLGDGVFETMRTYGGVPFRLQNHLARLAHSAAVAAIRLPMSTTELAEGVIDARACSGYDSAYVRVTLTRGRGTRGLASHGGEEPTLSIVVQRWDGYAASIYCHGVRASWARLRKIPAACLEPTGKFLTYLPAVLARAELGPDIAEGIQRAVDGQVVGGLASNIFAVRGGALLTPHLGSGCLPGITRAVALELAAGEGVFAEEVELSPADILRADEVFFTSSLIECLPVRELDGRRFRVSPDGIAARLRRALRATAAAGTTDGLDDRASAIVSNVSAPFRSSGEAC